MIKEPYKGHSKDSCQKHVDDSYLFTSIRHHTMPFVVPKPQIGEREIHKQKKLEQEIVRKFLSGDHRFSDALKAISMVIKPIFLVCVLPFYLGFYLVPVWLYSKGQFLNDLFKGKIDQKSKALRSKFEAILNPFKAYKIKLLSFKQEFIQRVHSLIDILKQKKASFKGVLFSNFKNLTNDFKSSCVGLLHKVKSLWLRFESNLRSYGKNLENWLAKTIEAPFIYIARQVKRLTDIVVCRLVDPPKKKILAGISAIKAIRQKVIDRKNLFVDKVKEYIAFFKAKLLKKKEEIFRLNIPLKKDFLKSSFSASLEKVKFALKEYVKKLKIFDLNQFLNPIFERWESLIKKPRERYLSLRQQVRKYKSDIRTFAIHLPGNIKKQIPHILAKIEKYNARFYVYLQRGRNAVKETLQGLIPSPVRHASIQTQKFFSSVCDALAEKRQEAILMLLIIKVWAKVILNHAKRLVTSHRVADLIRSDRSEV